MAEELSAEMSDAFKMVYGGDGCETAGVAFEVGGHSKNSDSDDEKGIEEKCGVIEEVQQQGGEYMKSEMVTEDKIVMGFPRSPSDMPEESSFPCDQCDSSFSSSKDLMAHIRGADDHEAICKLCNATFSNFDNMRNHKRKVHFANSQFVCDSCGMSFKTRDILKAHLDYVHKVEPDLNCNLCGRICQNMMKLRKHTLMCLSRDPDVVAQERLQFEALTKYQKIWYAKSAVTNTSGFGTKSPVEMDERAISLPYNGSKAEITSLPYDPKLEETIDNIKEEVIVSGELEFDSSHLQHSIFNETHSKDESKGEEKEELNKMDEFEGPVKIETEPDINDLVAPMKKQRKRNKIPVVAKACPICAKEVKYLYQHMKDIHETQGTDINGLVAPVKKRRKRNIIPVVAKACPICGKEVKYLYQHMRDVHTETEEAAKKRRKRSKIPVVAKACPVCGKEVKFLYHHLRDVHPEAPDMNGLVTPVKERKKRIRYEAVAKVCPICAKEVKWLSGHINAVHTEADENHVCNDCGKVFSKRKKLTAHINAVHKVEPSICDICSRVLKNAHALRGHKMKVHTIEYSKCQVCGSNFKNKILLLRHLKIYHKELFDAPRNYFENSMKVETLDMNYRPVHPQPVYPKPMHQQQM